MGANDQFGRDGAPAAPNDRLHDLLSVSATRSLGTLRSIEDTVTLLIGVVDQVRPLDVQLRALADQISALPPGGKELDPDDQIDALLAQIQDVARRLYHAKIPPDALLVESDVHDALATANDAVRSLFETVEDLRWAVREYDADAAAASGEGRTFESVEELRAALR